VSGPNLSSEEAETNGAWLKIRRRDKEDDDGAAVIKGLKDPALKKES
jgi:hypothetical protein